MKFLKFSLLTAVLLSVVFAFSSCGDDDDTGYLPPSQAIQDALKKLYPNATAIKWEQGVVGSNPATPTKKKEVLFFYKCFGV